MAIARAVYARKQIAFFDDVFSGIDGPTEKLVFDKLFGPGGLLKTRGTTAVLFTHGTRFLPTADNIIVLENGNIYQGTYDDLYSKSSYLRLSMARTIEN